MQFDFIRFAVITLLVFAPLFDASEKHVLTHFALDMAMIVADLHCSW